MQDLVERKAVLRITEETGAFETQHRVRKLPSVNPLMTENHKNFLNELAALFSKYSISNVTITDFKDFGKYIVFESNEEALYFQRWDNEIFKNVVIFNAQNDYRPGEQKSQNKVETPMVLCGECKYMGYDGICTMFADSTVRPSASDFCSKGVKKEDC